MDWQQQGDVTIKPVGEVPAGAKVRAALNGRFILAEGEVTGHAHAIPEGPGIEFYEKDGLLYLKNKKPVSLSHEEHATQTIQPGTWEIGGVKEYDHFAEEARRVID